MELMTSSAEFAKGMPAKREGQLGLGVWLSGALRLTAAAGPLRGQVVRIDETRTLRPDAFVELAVVSHSLTIEGWDRNEIQVTGEYDSEFESVEIEGGEQLFEFRIGQDRNSEGNRDGSSEILVVFPVEPGSRTKPSRAPVGRED